jgi:hypothetical protein
VRVLTYGSITQVKFPYFYWHDILISAKLLAAHSKGTARARSLEELHDKLQALRGEVSGHCVCHSGQFETLTIVV